jgi:hypothetical protein
MIHNIFSLSLAEIAFAIHFCLPEGLRQPHRRRGNVSFDTYWARLDGSMDRWARRSEVPTQTRRLTKKMAESNSPSVPHQSAGAVRPLLQEGIAEVAYGASVAVLISKTGDEGPTSEGRAVSGPGSFLMAPPPHLECGARLV